MADLDNESYDSVKALNTFLRVAATHRGVVVAAPLSYHDVRRAVEIDGEAVTPKEDADENTEKNCDNHRGPQARPHPKAKLCPLSVKMNHLGCRVV